MPNRNGIKQYVPILDDDTGLAIRECPNRSAVSDTFFDKSEKRLKASRLIFFINLIINLKKVVRRKKLSRFFIDIIYFNTF